MNYHLRWMYRRDREEVLAIEDGAFAPPDRWGEDDYLRELRSRNTIGMVAERVEPGPDGWNPVAGVMVYRLLRDRFEVLRLAVDPARGGEGIGRSLLDRLIAKASPARYRIVFDVPEDFLGAHLFLKACGFRATGVDRDGAAYGRDLYRFEYRLSDPAPAPAYRDWLGRLRRAAVDGGIAARAGWVVAGQVLRDAAGSPACPLAVPLPSIHPGDDGRVRLTWRAAGRSVHLHAGADGATVRLDPEAFPAWVHETTTTPECLARAFRWLFQECPAPATTAEEDRSC